jgi:CrcB protein
MNILLVAIGGAIGAMLRYGVYVYCGHLTILERFPYATLFVNVLGSFIMGFACYWLINHITYVAQYRLFLLTGILGAFTTFSAFSLDTVQLILAHRYSVAITYVLLSFVLCLAAVCLGMFLARAGRPI